MDELQGLAERAEAAGLSEEFDEALDLIGEANEVFDSRSDAQGAVKLYEQAARICEAAGVVDRQRGGGLGHPLNRLHQHCLLRGEELYSAGS